jgi:hypothetical protein
VEEKMIKTSQSTAHTSILGINYFFHDSSACLVQGGQLISALEEERFTRRKHTWQFPHTAIDRCIEIAGIDYGDIDHIAVSIKPTLHWQKKVFYALAHPTHLPSFAKHELWDAWNRQRDFWDWYKSKWGKSGPPVAIRVRRDPFARWFRRVVDIVSGARARQSSSNIGRIVFSRLAWIVL